MKIAVLVALKEEAKGIHPSWGFEEPNDFFMIESGMGKVNAAMGAMEAIVDGANLLICAGVCGSLSSRLPPLSTIVVEAAAQIDYGEAESEIFYPYKPGLLSGLEGADDIFYGADDELLEFAKANLIDVSYGSMATADSFEKDKEAAQEMADIYKVKARDMECAAIAQVAEKFSIPWIAIKTVTDRIDAASKEHFLNKLPIAASKNGSYVRQFIQSLKK